MSKVHEQLAAELSRWPRSLRAITKVMNNWYGHNFNDATISARIRDLRKDKYGKHNVVRSKQGKVHMYHIPKQDAQAST